MKGKSRWVTRKMKCPEGRGEASLLVEWHTEKGVKLLRSVSCDNPQLMDYGGEDCAWQCEKKLSKDRE